MTVILSWICVV